MRSGTSIGGGPWWTGCALPAQARLFSLDLSNEFVELVACHAGYLKRPAGETQAGYAALLFLQVGVHYLQLTKRICNSTSHVVSS